jgi:hypothetical protein
MEDERELYRTRIVKPRHGVADIDRWADCILTNRRLLVKWDNGALSQHMLTDITDISCGRIVDKTQLVKKHFADANSGRVFISLVTSEYALSWYSTSAYELVKQIQKAMMPF